MNNYIDLQLDGKLFPSFILKNFKEFQITINKDEEVSCDNKGSKEQKLREYQAIIGKYMDYNSPYRDILLYHNVGSGKTRTAINVYNSLFQYTDGWNVYILLKASLKHNWERELKKWMTDNYSYKMKNINFISYDAPNLEAKFMDLVQNADMSKRSLYIIDECHKFISNVKSNISSEEGRKALNVYNHIISDKESNPETRVILISGTPAINEPFELGLLFNLLRPGIFSKNESEFNQLFVSGGDNRIMNPSFKNMFQRRILGLVSYYIGADPRLFPQKILNFIDCPMSEYQQEIYDKAEEEEQILKRKFRKMGSNTSERIYTKTYCNFVFPFINDRINGLTRPKPKYYRDSDDSMNDKQYLKDKNMFIKELSNYFYSIRESDSKSIKQDIKNMMKYDSLTEYLEKENDRSDLLNKMLECSRKYIECIFNIEKSNGLVIVYSNYVSMEGLEIFKVYLKYFGYMNFNKYSDKNRNHYTEFHGLISMEDRDRNKQAFQASDNIRGEKLKVLLLSSAGAEGLDFSNIRQIHILDPFWHEVQITQIIGRGVRYCSHADLPEEDRNVEIYRYKSIRENGRLTTDEHIETTSRQKDILIQSFLDAVKETAIDCALFKDVNMLGQSYPCFQFVEEDLFKKNIGPAYKQDIREDELINNGTNSMTSQTIEIQVREIEAVLLMSKPDEERKYSDKKLYWFYDESGVVYDYDLKYPIGKVEKDYNGDYVKKDETTYVIDLVIPIPDINTES